MSTTRLNKILKKRKNWSVEEIGLTAYNLFAGFSFTGIPYTILSKLPFLSRKDVMATLFTFGPAAGFYCAHGDVKKAQADNEKIAKIFLFSLLYSSHLLEKHKLLGSEIKNKPQSEDQKEPSMSTKIDFELSDQDKLNIQFLQDIKANGDKAKCAWLKLSKGELATLRKYLRVMSIQTDDNFKQFYITVRDFYRYRNDEQMNLELNKFWWMWKKESLFDDPLMSVAIIHGQTLSGVCIYYIEKLAEEILQHVKIQILEQINNMVDEHFFLTRSEKAMGILKRYPIDQEKLEKVIQEMEDHFLNPLHALLPSAPLPTAVRLFIDRLHILKNKHIAIRESLRLFYNDDGLIFIKDFQFWMSNKMDYLHYSVEHSRWDIPIRGVLWLVAALGVFDTFFGESDCDATQSFDWYRMLFALAATVTGVPLGHKLHLLEKVKQQITQRFLQQFDKLAFCVESDNNFNESPSPQSPIHAVGKWAVTKQPMIVLGEESKPDEPDLAKDEKANPQPASP